MFTQFYLEDYFPPGQAAVLYKFIAPLAGHLKWLSRHYYLSPHSRGVTLYDLVNEGIYSAMPRTKRTTTESKPVGRFAADVDGKPKMAWVNVQLGDDDLDALERTEGTFEIAGAMLLAVAARGYGFSVKWLDKDQSFMCAITGVTSDSPVREMGVSCFASEPVDCVLGGCYKFEQLLGGEFRNEHVTAQTSKRRFR